MRERWQSVDALVDWRKPMSNPWVDAVKGRLSLPDAVALSDPETAHRAWMRLGSAQFVVVVAAVPRLERLPTLVEVMAAGAGSR